MMEMNMVAEGYYATKSAYELKSTFKKKVRTPIIETVYQILYGSKNAKKAFKALADRLD